MFAYEKPEQKKASKSTVQKKETEKSAVKPNLTGIPDVTKTQFENLSGFSFDDVRVQYNSDKPAQLQALAYTQGNRVYIAPGQEKHLGHELGHVVQQKQGRVIPQTNVNGLAVSSDQELEKEADTYLKIHNKEQSPIVNSSTTPVIQGVFSPMNLGNPSSKDDNLRTLDEVIAFLKGKGLTITENKTRKMIIEEFYKHMTQKKPITIGKEPITWDILMPYVNEYISDISPPFIIYYNGNEITKEDNSEAKVYTANSFFNEIITTQINPMLHKSEIIDEVLARIDEKSHPAVGVFDDSQIQSTHSGKNFLLPQNVIQQIHANYPYIKRDTLISAMNTIGVDMGQNCIKQLTAIAKGYTYELKIISMGGKRVFSKSDGASITFDYLDNHL